MEQATSTAEQAGVGRSEDGGKLRQEPAKGIAMMAFSAVLFTVTGILIKHLGAHFTYAVQAFFRMVVGFIVLSPALLQAGRSAWYTSRPRLMFVRCSLGALALTLSYYTFQALPLAEANAFSFTRVLMVAPLAALLIGERMRLRRTVPIIIGFLGVLVILRPQTGIVSLGHIVALAAAGLTAWSSVMVRGLTRDHSSLALMTWWTVIGIALVCPLAIAQWVWPSPHDLMLLVAMGCIGIANQWASLKALEFAEATVVLPVDYLRIVLAIGAGFLLFGEVPDLATWIGSAIIVGASLWLVLTERSASALEGQTA